ncbi:6-phosphofructokinase [bacterium]|nr:6-phosphofructokinase [bacterium]
MIFGVLTGGGDSPGINAATRAIVLTAIDKGHKVIGIRDGWMGLIKNRTFKLDARQVSGILDESGTILCTSRTNPYKIKDGQERILATLAKKKIDFLIPIGGDDTLGVAHKLAAHGLKAVGIPQTIDNDIAETDYSIGFDSAINFVMQALDRLHATAHSHSRIIVAEVMGRDAGWLALLGGVAGGADAILIPEVRFNIDDIGNQIRDIHKKGKRFALIAVAEGALPEGSIEQVSKIGEKDEFGHVILGGIGDWVAEEIRKKTGYETRSVILGHLQRGGSPTAFDRDLATRYGVSAVKGCLSGKFDTMVSLKGHKMVYVPLEKALRKNRVVDLKRFSETEYFMKMSARDVR